MIFGGAFVFLNALFKFVRAKLLKNINNLFTSFIFS